VRHVVHQDRDPWVGLRLEREERSWARQHREQTQDDTGLTRQPEISLGPTILIVTSLNPKLDSHARLLRAGCTVRVKLGFGNRYLNAHKSVSGRKKVRI